jgi:hypothetical protein
MSKKNLAKLSIMRSASQAVQFLEALRPGGPWWLNAFPPERGGGVVGELMTDAAEIDRFIETHNGKRNIYYTLNALRGTPKSSKPSKLDIAAVEFLQADLDPRDDESPKEAKARYGDAVKQSGRQPFAIIDSGNGVQALFRVERLELPGEFIKNEDGERIYAPAVREVVDDAEARIKAFLLYLGGTTGTQNVDRILRLPGTINRPNAKKRKDGRVECQAELLELNVDAPVYALEDSRFHTASHSALVPVIRSVIATCLAMTQKWSLVSPRARGQQHSGRDGRRAAGPPLSLGAWFCA